MCMYVLISNDKLFFNEGNVFSCPWVIKLNVHNVYSAVKEAIQGVFRHE